MSSSRAAILKAAQGGELALLQRLHAAEPSLLLEARSTTKGYSALHFAAMGGSVETIEWLISQGLFAADLPATVGDPTTPLQIALEYKRIPAARRLQQLARGASSADSGRTAPAAPSAALAMPRPVQRFPSWILARASNGGLDVTELDGVSPAVETEAARLVGAGQPVVWRRAALCPALSSVLERLGQLGGQVLDTNICKRADRKFVYFAPERLERGIYEPTAIEGEYAPMRLNEQLRLEQTLCRQRAMAERDAATFCAEDASDTAATRHDGAGRANAGRRVGESGWLASDGVAPTDGATYVMHKILEAASAAEAKMIAERGGKMPPHLRPGITRLDGLPGTQHALWMAGLDPIARPVAEATVWARVGALASAGDWGAFEQAGLMISGRDTLTPTHYDNHHNIFMQLAGAKRFLLLSADHTPNLYGFPALHPLDPLSRVDLELSDEEIARRWPRTRAHARGAEIILEAGDVLLMPQGVWHQVHSLDAHNVSMSLLFGAAQAERQDGAARGLPPGLKPPPIVGRLTPARRAAALAELAKSVEGVVASVVGPAKAAATLAALRGEADGGSEADAVRQLVGQCLAPAAADEKPSSLPSVEAFASAYLDERRFAGLPMRVA